MTMAAGICAVVREQSNSTATAAIAYQYRAMAAEVGRYPCDTEALYAPEIVGDFEVEGGKTQTGNAGIFKADTSRVIQSDCRV